MSMTDKYRIKPKRIEFAKLILVAVSLMTLAVTVFSAYMIWLTRDLSPLMYLIPAVFAEAATATGFYYRKAEKENEIKLHYYLGGNENEQEQD